MSINDICRKYNIRNYTINNDGTVDVDGNVGLSRNYLTILPLKFGKVSGIFDCSNNQLTTLEGSPKWVGKDFNCGNNEIKSLEGGPEVVLGTYYCYRNRLVNFKGFPEDYDGYINFASNSVDNFFINIPFTKYSKFIYWCNEYDAITDDGTVIPERMEEVYNKLGL